MPLTFKSLRLTRYLNVWPMRYRNFCFVCIRIYSWSSLVPNKLLFSDSQFGKYNKYHNYTNVHFLKGIFMYVVTKVFSNDASNKCFTPAHSIYLKEISKAATDVDTICWCFFVCLFFSNYFSVSNLFSLIQTTGSFMIPVVTENFPLHRGFRCNSL